MSFDYVSEPAAIEQLSRQRLRATLTLPPHAPAPLVERLVYAVADPDIVPHLQWHDAFMTAAGDALNKGCPVLTDSMMTRAGIMTHRLPRQNDVLCFLHQVSAKDAAAQGKTRTACAVHHWQPHLQESVVAIGNAPTALYELMTLWRDGAPLPAAIALFPLGFVGAAEAKQEFLNHYATVPFVTLTGRRGGSALAAAAINAAAHHS